MRITKKFLRKIIREELDQVQGYPGDGNEPAVTFDELESDEVEMNEVFGTIATIGAGVALGIAGLYGGVKLAGIAKSILGKTLHVAQRAAENKLGQLKAELRHDIQTQMMTMLESDAELDRLAKEYQDLTYQIQTKPKRAAKAGGPKRGGIKGLRGPEYAAIRKAQKAKAKEFADYLETAMADAWKALDPKTAKDARHLDSHELRMTRDRVKSYGRRKR
ncbi:MAG: hypothetical protein CME70_14010 [Halobacteriovorax sp.]|nr:hypothetical protein [Halobacteriovorax sp.]|tara:strand:+ start:3648 stop:4304 length:657 start_codon:yes stop_codon:yes gene_type:complete